MIWNSRLHKNNSQWAGLSEGGALLLCPPEQMPNKVVMINLVEKG
ncbi:hypothetical protein [Ferruginibacter sp.]